MSNVYFMLAQSIGYDQSQSSPIVMIVFMVGFVAFFYFVVIRPQNKKKKEMDLMLNNLKKGDKVATIGGIIGKISTVRDDNVVVKVNDNTEITFEKRAISRVVQPQNVIRKNDKSSSGDKKELNGSADNDEKSNSGEENRKSDDEAKS